MEDANGFHTPTSVTWLDLKYAPKLAERAEAHSDRSRSTCSLKHATDLKKTFPTQDEAFDRAKQMGLTPDQAAREIMPTPHGRYALYDAKKDEIAKPDSWKPPDFRSLIHAASTEAGKSELSCVLDDTRTVVMARPMILSDETRPTDYTFANRDAAHVQTDNDLFGGSTPR